MYTECSCIKPKFARLPFLFPNNTWNPQTTDVPFETPAPDGSTGFGTAIPGACPVDCMHKFYIFLAVVCLLKFSGATGRASNFLVSVRCVDEKDKTVAMGFGLTIMSLFAFIPSPILFGYILGEMNWLILIIIIIFFLWNFFKYYFLQIRPVLFGGKHVQVQEIVGSTMEKRWGIY